jgi:predicted acetyltransferase
MSSERLELRTLRVEDEWSFRKAVEEFECETPPWQFAFGFDKSLAFSDYVKQLEGHPRGVGLPEGFVPNTFFVGVVDGVVVGRLSLRHSLNDFLARVGGHIGYGVVPSQRRRGYATEMLRQAIPICESLGIEGALITCDEHNIGSRKVVEACGGVFEGIIKCAESGVPKRRYWLHTAAVKEGEPNKPPLPKPVGVTPAGARATSVTLSEIAAS